MNYESWKGIGKTPTSSTKSGSVELKKLFQKLLIHPPREIISYFILHTS